MFATNEQNPDKSTAYKTFNEYSNGSTASLNLPWASSPSVKMEKVYSKDEYSLWKCPANFVTSFPGQSIQGKIHNYFVYKNGKFHLTVTKMNKSSVFSFFTNSKK
jgi:hypothetical protein